MRMWYKNKIFKVDSCIGAVFLKLIVNKNVKCLFKIAKTQEESRRIKYKYNSVSFYFILFLVC